jgi:Endonuclease NucS
MKNTTHKTHPQLEILRDKYHGSIGEDGELSIGPVGREIWITTEHGETLWLCSKQPIYRFKGGKARSTSLRQNGFYETSVCTDDLDNTLTHSLGHSDIEVAYENVVEHFCYREPWRIEDGLMIYKRGRINGLQYKVGERRIDILAVDSNKDFVVIEFKRSAGHEKVLGQIVRYMSFIRKTLADIPGQKVRGIIIAHRITDDLREAASEIRDLELKEYEVELKLKKVGLPGK